MMMSDYYVIDEVIHNLDCFIEWFGKVSTEDYFVLYLVISERMILMKIGVISDTHNVLRDDVLIYLKECDYIIHAGDVCKEEIIERLNEIAKTFVVRGNNDKFEGLPDYLELEMNELLIYVVHDKKDIPKHVDNFDLVIYGHSHKYEYELKDGVIYLNPGGCGRRRFSLSLTMTIVTIEDKEIKVTRINLED